jgi:multidrug efflux pump subunit AcrA (membrane-fusion protein)
MHMTRILFLLTVFVFAARVAIAEGVVFAPEVQCDFEVKESYFLLAYESGRLEIIPTSTTPVRGRGDKALVGGSTVIVGGVLQPLVTSGGAIEQLTTIRAVLRGPGNLLKVVPVKPPIAEDLHTLQKTSIETTALIKSRLKELERAEGQNVQAEATLERMRSQVNESSESDHHEAVPDEAITQQRALNQIQRSLSFLEARYRKLVDNSDYPHANVIQASYESASELFRRHAAGFTKNAKAARGVSELSVEDKQRLMQLGRSFDTEKLKERLTLLQAKTKAFESRLNALGVSIETASPTETEEREVDNIRESDERERGVPVEITTEE